MMAFNSTPTPPERLTEPTLAAVRAALMRALDEPGRDAELERALRAMAQEARDKQMRAERLLIELKEIWATLPGSRRGDGQQEQSGRLQRLVTLCIDEYYSKS